MNQDNLSEAVLQAEETNPANFAPQQGSSGSGLNKAQIPLPPPRYRDPHEKLGADDVSGFRHTLTDIRPTAICTAYETILALRDQRIAQLFAEQLKMTEELGRMRRELIDRYGVIGSPNSTIETQASRIALLETLNQKYATQLSKLLKKSRRK